MSGTRGDSPFGCVDARYQAVRPGQGVVAEDGKEAHAWGCESQCGQLPLAGVASRPMDAAGRSTMGAAAASCTAALWATAGRGSYALVTYFEENEANVRSKKP
jgi:hypothetical protein